MAGKQANEVVRERKRADIVQVARRMFLDEGYEAVSVHRIAARVKVAPNTLYWYFADKDALLIAVLDELVRESLDDFAKRDRASMESQLLWVLDRFAGLQGLIATVHARVPLSEAIAAWHLGFHRLIESLIEAQLRLQGVAGGSEAHAARATMFVVEGILAHRLAPAEQRKLVKWLVTTVRRADTSVESEA